MAHRGTTLLIPGLLCTKEVFRRQFAGLSDIANVVVPENTGFTDMSALAHHILRSIPDGPLDVAGFSFGGYIALEMLRLRPSRIRRFALLSTQARSDSPHVRSRRETQMALALKEGSTRSVADLQAPLLLHPTKFLTNPEDPALPSDHPHVVALRMARATTVDQFVEQQRAIMSRRDGRDVLERIACPTLILAGRDDALCPYAVQEEMWKTVLRSPHIYDVRKGPPSPLHAAPAPAAKKPRFPARFHILEGVGHMSLLEQPDLVTESLRAWLAMQPEGGERA